MSNLKIGFIGCGKHARANIYPSVKLLNVDIACICTRHLDRSEAAARQFQARSAYDDYKRMLESENLDAVFVVTSGDQHAAIVEDCLRAGVHVFVEKPLGANAIEAKRIAEVSGQTGRHVMVGFMNRFAPSYLSLKKIIEEKTAFGDVLTLTGMYAIRNFFASGEETYLKYAPIHYVDLMRFLVGEVRELVGYRYNTKRDINYMFSFASEAGPIGNMYFSGVSSWGRHYEEVIVTGSKGYAKVENRDRVIYHYDSGDIPRVPAWQVFSEETHVLSSVQASSAGGWQNLYLYGYVGEIAHFLKCIEKGEEPLSSAIDNVKTMELCDLLLSTLKSTSNISGQSSVG